MGTSTAKMLLPTGRSADARHLRFDAEMDCWTVRCNRCREDLPCDDEFYSREGRGPASWCKACRAEKFREYWKRKGYATRKAKQAA